MSDGQLLEKYAHPVDGGWLLDDARPGDKPRNRENMLATIKFCLFLGQPVTDWLSSEKMFAITERIRDLDERVAALEADRAEGLL